MLNRYKPDRSYPVERKILLALCAPFLLFPGVTIAQQTEDAGDVDESNIEVVVVTGVRPHETLQLDISEVTQPGVDNRVGL